MIGRKRTVSYEAVVDYKRAHPHHYQAAIADYFRISQKQVSRILRQNGILSHCVKGRRPLKRRTRWHDGIPTLRAGQLANERFRWESLLVQEGLGLGRGTRIGGKHIYYGEDPVKEKLPVNDDDSTI
ncbi:MAG TPA: hypothetical protein VHV29_06880 [Terriglobales bacterium]|jgi:hypothetical protein|nr:hypothetical protein [Terriglobales bacterium]